MKHAAMWLQRMVVGGASVDECIYWPGCKDAKGYGRVHFDGKTRYAHRVALVLSSGEDLSHLEAAHSCGRPSCVNPMHLRWATATENASDKRLHGTNVGGRIPGTLNASSKLTEEQVLDAYSDPRSHAVVARELGVSNTAIKLIRKGRTWGWLTGHGR